MQVFRLEGFFLEALGRKVEVGRSFSKARDEGLNPETPKP